jgi:hypothetical protein
MRIFEVVNGSKSDFFGDEYDAKKFAKERYENEVDGVPFIDKHFVETPYEFAALLNEVTARLSGQATGQGRQTQNETSQRNEHLTAQSGVYHDGN